MDGCSRGNPRIAAADGILCNHQGDFLAAFGSFLSCQPTLYAKLMVVCKRLELATHLGYSALEVESDSAMVVSWIHSLGLVRWDYVYLLRRVCALISSSHIFIRHVLREATYAIDFMANWTFSH